MTDTHTPVLTKDQHDKFVGDIIDYGTGFVAPLYATVEAIERATVEAHQRQQWQHIETAPKDGTEVLCWRDDCGQFIASYTSPDSFPLTQDEIDQMSEDTLFEKDWFTQWPQAIRLDGSERPTHWQPLPPPPEKI